MALKCKKRFIFIIPLLLGLGVFHSAQATESLTRSTTTRNQTVFTNNADCRGDGGDRCRGSLGGSPNNITMDIMGGTLSFRLCSKGISRDPIDPPCRVAPPMIPPGADTQVGTGLNPISITDNGGADSFGGPTNDPIPSGSSNVMIPGFLVHGAVGEQTLRCMSEATCGTGTTQNIITHFQSFRSVPTGQVINPSAPGILCDQPRCHHIEFFVDQQQLGDDAADTPFKISFVIDSKTDSNGNLVAGTATGSWTQTCNTGGCGNETGTFHVNTTTFTPASKDFLTIDSRTGGGFFGNCSPGDLTDPFHVDGQPCR